MALRLLTFGLVVAACGSQSERGHQPGVQPADGSADGQAQVPVPAVPEPSWPADMPSQLGCTQDADCVYLSSSYPISPCCGRTGEFSVNAAWLARVGELRASGACAGVACPELELPSAAQHGPTVPECAARCIEGACSFRCATSVGGPIPPRSAP